MNKHIMQFRYYEDGNESNQPKNATAEKLVDGTIFKDYFPFTQLGIQTLPGTRFYLNDNVEASIIVGSTGIYELDLDGIAKIENLTFDSKSLELINSNNNAYLIIDVIYES